MLPNAIRFIPNVINTFLYRSSENEASRHPPHVSGDQESTRHNQKQFQRGSKRAIRAKGGQRDPTRREVKGAPRAIQMVLKASRTIPVAPDITKNSSREAPREQIGELRMVK